MIRRDLLASLAGAGAVALTGCSQSAGPSTTSPAGTARSVDTTTADGVVFTLAQVAIRDDLAGPAVQYRLRNDGDAEAVVLVRTVLSIAAGGQYEQSAFVSVPAGDEVTVLYVVVKDATLTDAERSALAAGDVSFETFRNGAPVDA